MLSETSALAGAAHDGSGCAAGGAAKLPSGPGGQLRPLGVAGAAQESCETYHGLPDRTGRRHEEEFVKERLCDGTTKTERELECGDVSAGGSRVRDK